MGLAHRTGGFMFNYENLSDYEFELLSCDIMSKKLGTTLHTFAKGKDGGIDVTDNTNTKNIVIQVKHYIKSSFAALFSSLQKEIDKVKLLAPNQYYICCAQRLTANNINAIYKLFSEYMDSPSNILTLNDFDSFLDEPCNSEILRKHYKLWLESTNILSQINNRNIFIDCESLLYEIHEQSKAFVKTTYYNQCIQVLESNRILLILGLPGVGKTVTTKMVALYYAANGHQIRYTTDGEISNLKKVISESEDVPELVILDDCLGQIYFHMKETQESELISLIKYISLHPKKKLIMNSRVTIYNEAKARSNAFNSFSEEKANLIKTIDMSTLPCEEKGMIFYNHLFFKGIPNEYYNNILINKNYKQIVLHPNYSPRIMEYVTSQQRVTQIHPEKYAEFIMNCLTFPAEIWSNEYNRRLLPEDRLFLTTLYSLTETMIDENTLRRAYNYRLQFKSSTDTTRNYFDEALLHLNSSMVRIMDIQGKRFISVINPSVNDFLKEILLKNSLEFEDLKQHCSEYIQIKRLFPNIFPEFVSSGDAYSLNYASERERYATILTCICKNQIMSETCCSIISTYINDLSEIKCDDSYSRNEILCCLLTPNLNSFYKVYDNISDNTLYFYFNSMDIDDYAELIELIQKYNVEFFIEKNENYFLAGINSSIDLYCQDVPAEEYYGYYDFSAILDSCIETHDELRYSDSGDPFIDQEYEISITTAEEIVSEWVEEDLINEIQEKLKLLPPKYSNKIKWVPDEFSLDLHNLDSYIEAHLAPREPDYDYEPHSSSITNSVDALDYIFK